MYSRTLDTCTALSQLLIGTSWSAGAAPNSAKLFHDLDGHCLLAMVCNAASRVTIIQLPEISLPSKSGIFEVQTGCLKICFERFQCTNNASVTEIWHGRMDYNCHTLLEGLPTYCKLIVVRSVGLTCTNHT